MVLTDGVILLDCTEELDLIIDRWQVIFLIGAFDDFTFAIFLHVVDCLFISILTQMYRTHLFHGAVLDNRFHVNNVERL